MWNVILSFIPDLVKGLIGGLVKKCEINLAPEFHSSIPYPMNEGKMQKFVNFQIRFGSESNLELIDAILSFENCEAKCEQRDAKLNGGRDWNSFNFDASKLTYVPDEIFAFKIRAADHLGHCCELSSDMQMKQFPHPDLEGIKSGRWEIQPKGIFKIKCSRRKKF